MIIVVFLAVVAYRLVPQRQLPRLSLQLRAVDQLVGPSRRQGYQRLRPHLPLPQSELLAELSDYHLHRLVLLHHLLVVAAALDRVARVDALAHEDVYSGLLAFLVTKTEQIFVPLQEIHIASVLLVAPGNSSAFLAGSSSRFLAQLCAEDNCRGLGCQNLRRLAERERLF